MTFKEKISDLRKLTAKSWEASKTREARAGAFGITIGEAATYATLTAIAYAGSHSLHDAMQTAAAFQAAMHVVPAIPLVTFRDIGYNAAARNMGFEDAFGKSSYRPYPNLAMYAIAGCSLAGRMIAGKDDLESAISKIEDYYN